MPLNNTAADALASDIAATLGDLPKGEDQSAEVWKQVCRKIFAAIAANGVVSVTIPTSSIVTAGSAATQTGPAAPVPLTGTVT